MLLFGLTFLILITLFLIWMIVQQRGKLHLQNKQLGESARELKHQHDLWEGNLLAQENERQRIAAQLHDDVCTKLGVLHLTFHRLRRMTPDQEEYTEMCSEINDLIGETLGITRKISHELVPPTLEGFGLIEALEELCEQIRNTGTADIRLQHNLERNDLGDVNTELNLFRIVQELTNNTLKHAEASFITIELQKEEGVVLFNYCDNGIGYDQSSETAKGLGLKNIFNRARMIGASVDISTAPDQGFEIRFAIPVSKD
jgi:signal transduction histidine kinase